MTFALKPSAAQRESLMRLADYLVIGIAVALPWSTSATVILHLPLGAGCPPDDRAKRALGRNEASGGVPAGRVVRARGARNAVGGCPLQGAHQRHRFLPEAAHHSVAHDPVPPLRSRDLGAGGIPRVRNAAARGIRSGVAVAARRRLGIWRKATDCRSRITSRKARCSRSAPSVCSISRSMRSGCAGNPSA